MEKAIPEFLQYGALGVLALGFIVILILFWRTDKRAQIYADNLKDAASDRSILIRVVEKNTEASTALAKQIENMSRCQDKYNKVIEDLSSRLANGRCPLDRENK